MYQIYNEDCLEGMKKIPDNSVDMILDDLPYNLTDCAWDKSVIDLSAMWEQFKRILKPYSSAVLFASGKFTHKLIASNWDWYKYKWIWVKNMPTMFVHAKNAPMRKFEEILVFSDGVINHASVSKRRMKYNPQGLIPCEMLKSEAGKDKPSQLRAGGRGKYKSGKNATKTQIHNPHPENTYVQEATGYPSDVLEEKNWWKNYNWERHGRLKAFGNTFGRRPSQVDYLVQEQTGYPSDVIYFDEPHGELQNNRKNSVHNTIGERPSRPVDSFYIQEQTGYPSDVLNFNALSSGHRDHPTQKPTDLLEYLIKTYTNEGELVLDATMGSGSTGVARVNTGRKFIGFETEQNFYEIARKRIEAAVAQREQSLFNGGD